jgi:nicotinate-nucleotide adenylyltransferase
LKIGILGGTFNPPHLAHLRLAEEVANLYELSRVIFIPCHVPPHKPRLPIAPAGDRLEMTVRACSDNPLLEVSDMEISTSGPSYTVNTLQVFAAKKEVETFFIMGADSLKEIRAWKDYDKLFSLAHFIVVNRPGVDFRSAWEHVPANTRNRFQDLGEYLIHETSKRLIPGEVEGLNISSTMVRSLVERGLSIRYLVPESVRTYISQKKLYAK